MSRMLPLGVGAVAGLATAALLAFHAILAADMSQSPLVQTTAVLSAVLEGIVLGVVGWMCSGYRSRGTRSRSKRSIRIISGAALTICALATASSVANLVLLSRVPESVSDPVMGTTQENFLTGTSVVLGLSFACQLVFIAMHHVWPPGSGDAGLSRPSGPRLMSHPKAVRYSRTMPVEVQADLKMGLVTPPQSSSGKSATETMSSIRSSLSNTVRPMTSRTRLLSTRDRYRGSLESIPYREGSIATQDSFDSWDTSSVDLQSRLTVMGASSPAAPGSRCLETIPASPTVSRSPSPGHPLDLPAPPARPRSRSFSPARRSQLQPLQQDADATAAIAPPEAHIHPLFRSDSPVPPPNVTAGTVVIAAPEAARVVSDRQSVRRMRSGSLPQQSPLSHQASSETIRACPSLDEQEEPEERKMTPPIPDWIMSAGARTSLNGYQIRKLKLDHPTQTPEAMI